MAPPSSQGVEFVPRTTKQRLAYTRSLDMQLPVVFLLGSAGTGKTAIACAAAAKLLLDGVIDKIYLTRPSVTAGE